MDYNKSYEEQIKEYDLDQLIDIKNNINKEKYYDRYQLVLAEIEKRQQELKSRKDEIKKISTTLRPSSVEFKLTKNKTINILMTAFVSALMPGLGHISCGKVKRGIVLYLLFYVATIIGIFFSIQPFPLLNIAIAILIFMAMYLFVIVDSIRIARNPKNYLHIKPVIGYIIVLGVFLIDSMLISPAFRTWVKNNFVRPYKIASGAMEPTLLVGDYILVDSHIYKTKQAKRGDIIIFPYPKDPSRDFTKRLIGLGRDVIEIKNKKLYINNEIYIEDYILNMDSNILSAEEKPRDNFGPITVPDNSLFFLGDNRDTSNDSRFWGFVDRADIKGKVINIYWSRDKKTGRIRWDRIGKAVD